MDFLSIQTKAKNVSERLSRADIVFYLMPAIMALLIVGTLAQAEMGLYEAHKKFFASFIFFIGPLPLPGGYTLLGILTLNLVLKFLFHSEWSFRKSGIILTHLGALVLLIGGLLTAAMAREGFMVIAEGDKTPFVYDYHEREFLIYEDDRLAHSLSFEELQSKEIHDGLPFTLRDLNKCENCEILKREEHEQSFAQDMQTFDMARFMALEPKEKNKEAEVNLSGLSFEIEGIGENSDGLYVAFEAMPKPIELSYEGRNYKMIYGKAQRQLPFEIGLKDFQKKDYPGMSMARGFSSDVSVYDQGAPWEARIEMNAPLRYKGYTFYQSSFDQSAEGETTVLSVVENKGRIFPYLGTFIITLGLLLHLWIVFVKRRQA